MWMGGTRVVLTGEIRNKEMEARANTELTSGFREGGECIDLLGNTCEEIH